MSRRLSFVLLLASLSVGACRNAEKVRASDAEIVAAESLLTNARASRLEASLAGSDTGALRDAPIARWPMPTELREISGLTLTADGRLLVHQDQSAIVWEVDYRRGVLVKRFSLGTKTIKGDFESIAAVGDTIYLFTSTGLLYRFAEGANDAHVEYTMIDTGLKPVCEFESMTYEPASKSLLFACKALLTPALADSIVIFKWKVAGETARGMALPRLTVPMARVVGANAWKSLKPSDITIDPRSGNYVLIASKAKVIFSITPKGALVFARALPPGHAQAEGIAITKDSILLISDEGQAGQGQITLYHWPLR